MPPHPRQACVPPAKFEQEFIEIDLEEAIARDSLRSRPVGRAVIEKTYNKWLANK